MLDEAEHVESLVADIAAQDFDGNAELLVADGGSTDGSVERLIAAAEQVGLALTVVENPGRWVSRGLNACIRRATGDLIVRLDCHCRYPPDYLRRCVLATEETGAWNVGGRPVPVGRTEKERAVACAMDGPFGGIGWTRMAPTDRRIETDTVFLGAFRREAFERAGLFDESLIRNQDDEFNLRLRSAGGQVVLDPSIRPHYRPRPSLAGVFRQYYEYGFWKIPIMLKHRRVVTARSLAPFAFVCSVALLTPYAAMSSHGRRMLATEISAYAGLALLFGAGSIRGRKESMRLLPLVTVAYPAFHIAYGLGMAHALFRVGIERAGRLFHTSSGADATGSTRLPPGT